MGTCELEKRGAHPDTFAVPCPTPVWKPPQSARRRGRGRGGCVEDCGLCPAASQRGCQRRTTSRRSTRGTWQSPRLAPAASLPPRCRTNSFCGLHWQHREAESMRHVRYALQGLVAGTRAPACARMVPVRGKGDARGTGAGVGEVGRWGGGPIRRVQRLTPWLAGLPQKTYVAVLTPGALRTTSAPCDSCMPRPALALSKRWSVSCTRTRLMSKARCNRSAPPHYPA
jgi:hypothetical protein